MKKILFLVATVIICFGACKKSKDSEELAPEVTDDGFLPNGTTVEKVNKAAYFHFSEDWCGPCGAYGGPTFDSVVKTLEGTSATCVKVYQSSNNTLLECRLADIMENASNYNITSIPSLFVGNGVKFGVGSNIPYNYGKVKSQADAFKATTVTAGVFLTKELSGTNMNIKARVQFFEPSAAGKDYRLAVYLLENIVISSQVVDGVGTVGNYKHHNVWRAGNGPDYKGDKLNTAAVITADQQFDRTYSIPLKSNWITDGMKVVAVIWDCTVAGKPKLVNSNVIK